MRGQQPGSLEESETAKRKDGKNEVSRKL